LNVAIVADGNIGFTFERVSPFAPFLDHLSKISYGYRNTTALLTTTQGGRKMNIKEAGKLWLEYHRFNSQKKYGQVL
jgi:hypothetical protein